MKTVRVVAAVIRDTPNTEKTGVEILWLLDVPVRED